MLTKKECCRILGVSENSTIQEIKNKYYTLAEKYHPDINNNFANEQKFKEINEVYNALKTSNFI